jgi:hypothetical protein
MTSSSNPGRVAGFLYLLLGFSVFRPIYVERALIVRNNALATAHNIATHESLFRLGIVCDLLAGLSCLVVALALYHVLKGVDRGLGILMVLLGGCMPLVIDFLNSLNDIAALLLARGDGFLSAFSPPQQAALATLFLRVHEYGLLINEIFAGLWLFPFGILVFRSVFIPRVIGVALMVNGCAYVTIAFTGLLAPNFVDRVTRVASPALLGEGAIMLWLVIKGARPQLRPVAAIFSTADG